MTTEWLDPHAAAAYCGCHRETIRRAFRAGALQGWHVGRVIRTKREHLDAWIAAGGRTMPTNDRSTRVGADDDSRPLTAEDGAAR